MAERVAEDSLTALVEVLSIDEDRDPLCGVTGERRGGMRWQEKGPVKPLGKPGPVNESSIATSEPGGKRILDPQATPSMCDHHGWILL
jgi:hypothetical protein